MTRRAIEQWDAGYVRTGRIRSVVVTKLDRISRSLANLPDLMCLFEAHGVKFISQRENSDTSGPVGRIMLHILGAITELERAITAERVAEDMKLRARRGKWNRGLALYGRRVEDGKLQIVPEEAAILQRMRELLPETRTWRGVDVFDELRDVVDQRRLPATCLRRVVLKPGALEIHVTPPHCCWPPGMAATGSRAFPGGLIQRPPGVRDGDESGQNGDQFPCDVSSANAKHYGSGALKSVCPR